MRYSSAAITALILSFFTFLGMTLLVTTNKYTKSESFEPIEFSKINDMEKIDPTTPPKPKTPPKQEQVKHPPALPKINITENNNQNRETIIIEGIAKPETASFSTLAKPTILQANNNPDSNHGLIVLLPVMPQYPIKQLNNKIEGWVKVGFVVNELGKATQIKVLDAKPKRVFDQATIRAIRKSKFKPLMINGKAAAQSAIQVIEFKLEK